MVCRNCGEEVASNTRFCPYCGENAVSTDNAQTGKETETQQLPPEARRIVLAVVIIIVALILGAVLLTSDFSPGTPSRTAAPNVPSSSATQATVTRSTAISQAKVLVWKHLGEPRYDVLTVSRATNTVADVWDVSGRFAYVGSAAQSFEAIVEKQKSGDWWLLAFSWK